MTKGFVLSSSPSPPGVVCTCFPAPTLDSPLPPALTSACWVSSLGLFSCFALPPPNPHFSLSSGPLTAPKGAPHPVGRHDRGASVRCSPSCYSHALCGLPCCGVPSLLIMHEDINTMNHTSFHTSPPGPGHGPPCTRDAPLAPGRPAHQQNGSPDSAPNRGSPATSLTSHFFQSRALCHGLPETCHARAAPPRPTRGRDHELRPPGAILQVMA